MKNVAVILADGFEEIEGLTVVDVLRRAEIKCEMVSINKKEVIGAHSIKVLADRLINEELPDYDMIVLPGGMPGATNLRDDERVINLIKKMNKENKKIAAICAAPIVLGKADVIKNKNVTSYPGFEEELKEGIYHEESLVQVDSNIITSRGPATALEFAYTLVKELKGNEASDDLRTEMLYSMIKNR